MSGRGPILVVEDDATNMKLTRIVLEAAGYAIIGAENAGQALACLEATRPALVLMDLQLPGMDGLTLTRHLKAEPATRDIPVVALTANAMVGDEAKALEAGCDGYITKPIDTRRLPAIVSSYMPRAGAPLP